jgi:hypothetical protein
VKLVPDGTRVALSGFLPADGGLLDHCYASGPLAPLHVHADDSGDAIVFGRTSPTTRDARPSPNAIEPIMDGQGLLMVIAASGQDVRYATSLAGGGINGVARDAWGNFVTVDERAVVRTVAPQREPIRIAFSPARGCAGRTITVDAQVAANYDQGAVTFAIDDVDVATSGTGGGRAALTTTLAAGVHRLRARYGGRGLFDGYPSPLALIAVDQAGACP